MILFKTIAGLRIHLDNKRNSGASVGFVPTMGALHDGHLSLVEHSKKNSRITVCSIFVNPTQFNDPADFAKYPVTLDKDLLLLEKAGCDIVFLPSVTEIYPAGTTPARQFDLGYLETILEGKYRPGHFQGVCQVVYRLLEIVQPTTLFLGRKDYQQCMVIRRLIELAGWNIELDIIPTLREVSGLALSSRNLRLSEKDRRSAAVIYQALSYIKEHLAVGDVMNLVTAAEQMILAAGFDKTDYVSIADADTLENITEWNGETKLVALVAAFIGGVRLIDNRLLN
ncbi:MAG: pantoate--beta-alanine ligase [Sediminibacterium sp.]